MKIKINMKMKMKLKKKMKINMNMKMKMKKKINTQTKMIKIMICKIIRTTNWKISIMKTFKMNRIINDYYYSNIIPNDSIHYSLKL